MSKKDQAIKALSDEDAKLLKFLCNPGHKLSGRRNRGLEVIDERRFVAGYVFDFVPDYAYWTPMASWTAERACALFSGIDPNYLHGWKLYLAIKDVGSHDKAAVYDKVREYMLAEWQERAVDVLSKPETWLLWARRSRIAVPDELAELLAYSESDGQEASAEDKPATGHGWRLIERPDRFYVYKKDLYDFLENAKAKDLPCPTKESVYGAWLSSPPPSIHMSYTKENKLTRLNGAGKEADLTIKAIGIAIDKFVINEH